MLLHDSSVSDSDMVQFCTTALKALFRHTHDSDRIRTKRKLCERKTKKLCMTVCGLVSKTSKAQCSGHERLHRTDTELCQFVV